MITTLMGQRLPGVCCMSVLPRDGKQRRMATTPNDPKQYVHRAAVDPDGNRIGKISRVYLDDRTGEPLWVLVETGLLGTRQSFAPVHGSRFDEELVVLAVSKEQVKDAPGTDEDAQLTDGELDALRQYYSGYLGAVEGTSTYQESSQARRWTG